MPDILIVNSSNQKLWIKSQSNVIHQATINITQCNFYDSLNMIIYQGKLSTNSLNITSKSSKCETSFSFNAPQVELKMKVAFYYVIQSDTRVWNVKSRDGTILNYEYISSI